MRKRRLVTLAVLLTALLTTLLLGCGDAATTVDEGQAEPAPDTPTTQPTDTTPPTSYATYPESWTQGPVTVEFSVEDDCCAAAECTINYSMDDRQSWETGAAAMVTKQGEQRVWVYAVDLAGNEEEVGFCDLLIDNGTPVTQALNSPGVQKGKSVTLTYRIEDRTPRAEATLRLTGPTTKTIELGSQPTNIQRGYKLKASLPAGSYTWSIYARDQAGNKATQRSAATLTVTKPPAPAPAPVPSELVGITETGECYHRLDCYHWTKHPAGNSKVTVEEAKAMGFRPCKVCNPPQ